MRGYLLAIWNVIDPIYYKFTRLRYIINHDQQKTVFRVRLVRYKGIPVVLKDGTDIQKNDLLLKIHLHNVKILKKLYPIKSDIRRAVLIYHQIKYDLPELAKYIKAHEKSDQIKGIVGITSIYQGANRLGFEIVPMRSKFYRLFKQCAFLFIQLFAKKSKRNNPTYLFMSKQQLLTKYHHER